jgi:hypothetical protein
MNTGLFLRLAMTAASLFAMALAPAAAADADCKAAVTAEGKPAALRDLGAYPNSLLAWRAAVREKYGQEYNSWRYAKDRDVDCQQKDGQWRCVRNAKPCKDVLHRLIDSATGKANCKGESVSSYGARKKSEAAAIEQAEYGWMIDTRKKYGKDWAVWKNAADTDIDCHKVSGGLQCIAVGVPCEEK